MPTLDERIEAAKALIDPVQHGNTGHGHVFPRPDGAKMRCGGPAMCKVCAADRARKPDTLALALDLAAERERLLAEIERLREAHR